MIELCCEYYSAFDFMLLLCHVRISEFQGEEFLDIQATVECVFTLKLVRDMIITYS